MLEVIKFLHEKGAAFDPELVAAYPPNIDDDSEIEFITDENKNTKIGEYIIKNS